MYFLSFYVNKNGFSEKNDRIDINLQYSLPPSQHFLLATTKIPSQVSSKHTHTQNSQESHLFQILQVELGMERLFEHKSSTPWSAQSEGAMAVGPKALEGEPGNKPYQLISKGFLLEIEQRTQKKNKISIFETANPKNVGDHDFFRDFCLNHLFLPVFVS